MAVGSTPRAHSAIGLLHAVPQHLIGRDEHDTDDESHGEGADQAFPDARLTVLLLGMDCRQTHAGYS